MKKQSLSAGGILMALLLSLLFFSVRVKAEDIKTADRAEELVSAVETDAADLAAAIDSGSDYQMKRIMVHTDELSEDFGAAKAVYYEKAGEYYLTYENEEETRLAYEKLRALYGEDCVLDSPIRGGSSLFSEAASSGNNWELSMMGFDSLKVSRNIKAIPGSATVAVIDTGVSSAHQIFSGKKFSKYSRSLIDGGTYKDIDGHGTFVAGIIAESTPDQVEIMALRIYKNVDGEPCTSASCLEKAIWYAIDKGADVINLSLGLESDTGSLDACLNSAYKKGIPVVCAAGNGPLDETGNNTGSSGENVSHMYPASSDKTIAVSALKKDGSFAKSFGRMMGGSNYGAGIDFCAPGYEVMGARYSDKNGYTTKSGTSMAAPYVAAAAAYIKLALPNSSAAQVKSLLKSYAVDYGNTGKDIYYGYGVINLSKLKINLSRYASLSFSSARYVCSGSEKKPALTVEGIPKGMYTVSYKNNIMPGEASVTISGKGLYYGKASAGFTICPAAPRISSVTNEVKGSRISWKAAKGADSYQIWKKKAGGSYKLLKTVSASKLTYLDKNVKAGKSYSYKILSVGQGIKSSFSRITKNTFVKAGRITRLQVKKKGIKISFCKVRKASGYYIYRKSGSETAFKKIKRIRSAGQRSYLDRKVTAGESYTYMVLPYKWTKNGIYKGAALNQKTVVYDKRRGKI